MQVMKIIPLQRSVKLQKASLLNDLIPAVILFLTGVGGLITGSGIKLALANIVSGGLITAFGSKEWRGLAEEHHHRFQWYDVVCGAVMMMDAVMMYKPWKGFQPADLYFGMSIFLVLKGFSVVKLPRLRVLKITDEGFSLRTRPFFTLRCAWKDVSHISMDGTSIVVTIDGKAKTISLRRVENRDEVFQALRAAMQR